MTWASGDSGPPPILHRSQADTESLSQFRLGQSEMFTQLAGAIGGRRVAISWGPEDRERPSTEAAAAFASNTTLV